MLSFKFTTACSDGNALKVALRTFRLLPMCVLLHVAVSCSLFSVPEDSGGGTSSGNMSELRLSFDWEAVAETKAASESIDTNSFLLDIRNSGGDVIYSGKYGDSPEKFELPADSYTVRAVSSDFKAPAFSTPQYGDEQCVVLPSGKAIGVKLNCTMMNCGICLKVASGFLTQYPKSSLFVKSDDGRLPYSYTERRIAYFRPGKISLQMASAVETKTLMTRSLSAGDVLRLSVNVAASSSSGGTSDSGQASAARGIRIAVDTSKNWISGTYTIGGGSSSGGSSSGGGGSASGPGDSDANAMTIAMAKESIGETDVWVGGYVVGGDLTSAKAVFTPPFKSKSNILIGPRSSVTSRDNCLSVQLAEGDARDELNLVDNPQMLGHQVLLCGDIVESYYGMPGIKNISDFVIK